MRYNLLLEEIDWDTPNQTLARSLPSRILIINLPKDDYDEKDVNQILETAVGVKTCGYVGYDPTKRILNENVFVVNWLGLYDQRPS